MLVKQRVRAPELVASSGDEVAELLDPVTHEGHDLVAGFHSSHVGEVLPGTAIGLAPAH